MLLQRNQIINWFKTGRFLTNEKLAITLWFGLSFLAVLREVLRNTINNYIIYKYVFIHTVQQVNLYLHYPTQYDDVNLYGPLFSVIIAPFTYLPDRIGVIFWVMANVAFLYIAIRKLPLHRNLQNTVLIFSSLEMLNAASWLQTNALICGGIILTFVNIRKNKEIWAVFFMLLATFIKVYGIVGFAFLFFEKRPLRFIGWCIVWSIVFIVLPMIFSSSHFILHSYMDWKQALIIKDLKNVNLFIHNDFQDISLHGILSRLFGLHTIGNFILLGIGFLLFLIQYVHTKCYNDICYQLYILCSTLLFVVLFSTSSESPTYIISFPAICIWYVLQPSAKWVNIFFIFAFIVTSFSYSDLLTPWIREHIARPYSIKAIPAFITWVIIFVQIIHKQFLKISYQKLKC